MAAYSKRHYGDDTWALEPRAIVLHYTGTYTYAAAHETFASDTLSMGELPGVAAHYVIDKNGTIYQQVPLDVRARHTIGLNWCAIGIEFVQEAGSGPAWAVDQIFARRVQLDAGLRLVSWLQASYGIPAGDVLGHATANSSPLFKDLEGWRNDHVDWDAAAVARFKAALLQGV
jgi:N-acetyl-anhydromuramyl-L-alanine amidase AmpD